MNNDSGKKITDSPEANLGRDLKQVSNSRRSFAKAGLIAPVMLSLANRPAWGASFRCTVSGFDSLATIGSGPALSDIEAMCDYMSVDDVIADSRVNLNQLVTAIFPSCAGLVDPANLTVGQALQGLNGADQITERMVAAYFNEVNATNPFGKASVEEIYCHIITNGPYIPYSFGGVILNGLEIFSFLGYIGVK